VEGTIYTVRVMVRGDLNRQLVKSQTCTITIPEFDLTLPPGRGQLTTIEGLVREVIADLSIDQPVRKHTDAVTHDKIQAIINGLKTALSDEEEDTDETALASGTVVHHKEEGDVDDNDPVKPFTLRLDDPAGNSFLEFHGSTSDPKWNMRTYARSKQQNIDIGLAQPDDEEAKPTMNTVTEEEEEDNPKLKNEEIYVFPGICSSCGAALDTMMKKVSIPYFQVRVHGCRLLRLLTRSHCAQDVLIMSTNCDRCGYRDNEVKSGAAVSEKGRRIILKVEDSEDLSRDILKSETCGMEIPEIELVLNAGTLGGRFTTLEGILNQIYEELSEKVFTTGDSSSGQDRSNFQDFLSNLRAVSSNMWPAVLHMVLMIDNRSNQRNDRSRLSSMIRWPTRTSKTSTLPTQTPT
jgi:zinc finger protein